jgi:MoxR-like ATPase
VAPELLAYVLDLALASRQHAHLTLGLSTRGALAVLRAARIAAALRGSSFVAPDDVKEVLPSVISHRLVLGPEAMLEGVSTQSIVQRMLDQVTVPR